MGAAVGIDLGTTYSAIARVNESGIPEVIPNAEGSPITPSVVLFDGESAVVGAVAKEALATDPENVVQLIKRHMGSKWVFSSGGVTYRPEHISALILRKVVHDASLLIGPIDRAVITVPAYFNDSMRLATRQAGEMAGLEVLSLVSEPTAAAIAFGYDHRPEDLTGVVFDLGGGTFDVTVMRIHGSELRVLATGGDPYLGGANFDKAIFDELVARFAASQGITVTDPDALSLEEFAQVSQEWLARANRAKHDLTARERTAVALQVRGRSARVELTRERFEGLIRVLLDEAMEKTADVLSAAGLSPPDVNAVLAVGGAIRVPAVRRHLHAMFGRDPDTTVRPDEAVALGAALFAARRQIEEGEFLTLGGDARQYLEGFTLSDVAAHSLGLLVYDRPPSQGGRSLNSIVLARNTPLPFEGSRTFYTARAGQEQVTAPILEGEDPDPQLCTRVAEVSVTGLPPGRPAQQPVTVTLRYNRDGILEVTAKDENSGVESQATIRRTSTPEDTDNAAAKAVAAIRIE